MKSSKTAPIILLSAFFLSFCALRTGAQQRDWGKLTVDARMAHQRGDYSEAVALYKRALAIPEQGLRGRTALQSHVGDLGKNRATGKPRGYLHSHQIRGYLQLPEQI